MKILLHFKGRGNGRAARLSPRYLSVRIVGRSVGRPAGVSIGVFGALDAFSIRRRRHPEQIPACEVTEQKWMHAGLIQPFNVLLEERLPLRRAEWPNCNGCGGISLQGIAEWLIVIEPVTEFVDLISTHDSVPTPESVSVTIDSS